jgi:hypothetical protein
LKYLRNIRVVLTTESPLKKRLNNKHTMLLLYRTMTTATPSVKVESDMLPAFHQGLLA